MNNRKFKYGAISIALTAAVIIAVILFNAVFSALANNFMWHVDMTGEQIYALSDEARPLLDELATYGENIEIIFCMPFDKLEENELQKMVYNLARQMEAEYDFISVDYIDIITYPSSLNQYKIEAANRPNQYSVIVSDGVDSRVYTLEAFFVTDEDSGSLFGFQGEYKFISGMLQMVGQHPIAYFTTGHGEQAESSALYELFASAGYEVRTIDLTREEIDEDAQVMVINGPLYDFAGSADAVNEIRKVDNFLDDFGSLMVFLDPNTTDGMVNLTEFLEEWGIGFTDAVIKDHTDSISVDGTALVAQYTTEGTGASLHTALHQLASPPKTIVRKAMPVVNLFGDESRNSRRVSSVLTTTPNALAYSIDNEDTVVSKGPFDLMLISTETQIIDNENFYNHVLVTGTSEFIKDDYIASATYGNSDIIYSVMRAMGKTTVPVDLTCKVFDNNSLDITTAQANTWTIVLMTVIPVIVCICGIAVWIRRRHL